jgi:MFS family permease
VTSLVTPLRSRAFRWLEGTAVFANTGVWMVSLVGGFIMERLTSSPILVTFAASMSPLAGICAVVISGAIADVRDRRAVLLFAKLLLAASLAFLSVISALGALTPSTLLLGIAGMGLANGVSSPSWWATVSSLVPAEMAAVALSLDSFQWNIGQIVGPVLGGAILIGSGSTEFFSSCVLLVLPLIGFLFVWRGRSDLRLSTPGATAAESLVGAISSGWRYFSNTPGLRAIAARTALYATPAAALSALLPLFATHYLHTSAFDYGLFLALIGAGATAAALALPRLRHYLHLDALVAGATLANGLSVAALVVWPNRIAAIPVMLVAGASWVWATMAFVIAARQVTPAWVETRSLSLYYVVLQGPFVLGGLGFGIIDSFLSLRVTLLI